MKTWRDEEIKGVCFTQSPSIIESVSNPQPLVEQPQPEEKDEKQNVVEGVKVISGTQGLADYLGCSKSMAFGIISRGVLKDIGIQYMVGKCWKFNREKLDKYLKEHPDLLANVRCKR
ncbi:MAG: helix-turn-helix domain-containing protein [Bacteroidales bacterium]|nr:helix-turn-helix domain-containing protein [Bacteroidales bacterium]